MAIVDIEEGQQPYRLQSGSIDEGRPAERIGVVFNGEIYNHKMLRRQLRAEGYRFPDRCDGSVLPALYHRYGAGLTDHLDGMYAIAVLDLRAEPTLVLATDETGMKPLYYHRDAHGGIYFASEIQALRDLTGAGRSPRLSGLDDYLTTKAPFGERTMFDDIQVMSPATTAVITAQRGMRLRSRPIRPATTMSRNPAIAAITVQETLRHETHRLGRAEVPVAVITSGGLDSSLVTALLAERAEPVHGFHISYRGRWPFDERHFARMVARRCGAKLHEVELDPARLPDLLPEVVRCLGQPNADPITVSTFALFRAVREHGFSVALTGDGADEFFGGYDRIRGALVHGQDWAQRYVNALAAIPRPMRWRLYSADYRAYLAKYGTAEQRLLDSLTSLSSTTDRLSVITDFEVGVRMPAYHLRRVDHLSMAHAVEVRLPFCQPAVASVAKGLPSELRARPANAKVALYAAAEGILPEPVQRRPKQPFTLPITAMLTEGTPLFQHVRDVLDTRDVDSCGQLDRSQVRRILDTHAVRPTPDTALALWSLTIHRMWWQETFSRATGQPKSEVA